METRGTVIAAAGTISMVQVGLFAWLKTDIAGPADRVERVERAMALVRGQLSLALPALAGQAQPGSKR